MSELSVGALSGLASNSYVIDVASGSTLDLSNGAVLPAGSILQVVQGTKTDTFVAGSIASGASTEITGLSATITPSSASNKIMVFGMVSGTSASGSVNFILQRGASAVGVGVASGSRTSITVFGGVGAVADVAVNAPISFLDEPATTSATTYTIDIHNSRASADTVYVNRTPSDTDAARTGRSISTIILMEVAG